MLVTGQGRGECIINRTLISGAKLRIFKIMDIHELDNAILRLTSKLWSGSRSTRLARELERLRAIKIQKMAQGSQLKS